LPAVNPGVASPAKARRLLKTGKGEWPLEVAFSNGLDGKQLGGLALLELTIAPKVTDSHGI
jgi:hypothetical protein